MARHKTSQVITIRIPLEDYFKIIDQHRKIAPYLRALIKKSLNKNKIEKNEDGIFIPLSLELRKDWLKLSENVRESGIRAYIKNAIKYQFKNEKKE